MADTPDTDPDQVAVVATTRAIHEAMRSLVAAGFDPGAVIAAAHGEVARQAAALWGNEDAARLCEDTAGMLRTLASSGNRALAVTPPKGSA